jgi:hypothetical protein
MRPIKDYSVARLAILGFGVGIIIASLRIAAMAVFKIGASSAWAPFVTGAIAGVVVILTLHYFSKRGRDIQLLRKGAKH